MKTKKYCLVLLMVTFISFPEGLNAQENPNGSLLGTWVMDYNQSLDKMEPSNKSKYNRFPEEVRSRIEDSYRNRKISFEQDGNYSQLLSNGQITKGKWKTIKDGGYVQVTDSIGNTYVQEIKELTGSHLVLKFEDSGNSKMIINEWHLVKN